MDRISFAHYRKGGIQFLSRIRALHAECKLDDSALPAYTNPNPLMRWLFWERIRIAISYLEAYARLGRVMDFGCGLGVMLPYLNAKADSVLAVDLDISLVKQLGKWEKVEFADDLRSLDVYKGELDFILALDVLEHVNDLDATLLAFRRLLKPSGMVLVSGPTENLWYKLGRKLAGYSGDYHLNACCEMNCQSIRSAKARLGRPSRWLSQMQKLWSAALAAKRA